MNGTSFPSTLALEKVAYTKTGLFYKIKVPYFGYLFEEIYKLNYFYQRQVFMSHK